MLLSIVSTFNPSKTHITFQFYRWDKRIVRFKIRYNNLLTEVKKLAAPWADAVVLHMGTNHLPQLSKQPWRLGEVVDSHLQLVQDLRMRYQEALILVSGITSRKE